MRFQCEAFKDKAERPICFPAQLPKQVYHGLGRQRVSGISPFDSGSISGLVQSGSSHWRYLCFGPLAPSSLHESAFSHTKCAKITLFAMLIRNSAGNLDKSCRVSGVSEAQDLASQSVAEPRVEATTRVQIGLGHAHF
jgi:hypothetical protein